MKQTPIDARVIALDETESSWLGKNSQYIAKVLGVYLYDKNSHVHCCSLSPDYFLIHLYNQVVLTEEGEALSDREKEKLYEEYEQTTGDDDCYMSVYDIDRLEGEIRASGEKFRYYTHGDRGVDYDETTHDEQMEALREHFCSN